MALAAGNDASPVTPTDMAKWVPLSAGSAQVHVIGRTAQVNLYIDGESSQFDWIYNTGAYYDSNVVTLPLPTAAKQFQYKRNTGFDGGQLTVLGWIDEWVDASESSGSSTNPSVDSTAFHTTAAGEINALTEKTTPVSADLLLIEDSAASNVKKKVQVGNLPAPSVDFANASNILSVEVFT